jgi:hypothetical protein
LDAEAKKFIQSPDKASIFIRPEKGGPFRLMLDDLYVGTVQCFTAVATYQKLNVPPGIHTLAVTSSGGITPTNTTITVEAGKSYFFKLTSVGWWPVRVALKSESEEVARKFLINHWAPGFPTYRLTRESPLDLAKISSTSVENRALDSNHALATLVISMGPPTVISFVNGRLVNDEWDPAAGEDRYLARLKTLLDQGADPNPLHISGFQPRLGWDRKSSEGATSSFAVRGSEGTLVEPVKGGDSLLGFCRKYKLTRAAALLEEHGAK